MSTARPVPAELPIDSVLPTLRATLADHNRCLLIAQPGAGKTTRVPLALLPDTKSGERWLMLEPRRVAARLAATYMAGQLNEKPGQTVGYRVRGDSKVSASTRVEVVTQGILTRMLQDDPALDGVAGLIFDEFHERSLDADLGLALALDVQQGLREDLRILVMSATLDTDSLLTVMGNDTRVIDCPGRQWPVTTFYRPAPLREPAEKHQATVVLEALRNHPGHMLVFLPGQREIRRLESQLQNMLPVDVEVMPLHGQLRLDQQQAVLRPQTADRRRIILSTAIAESSLTVPGVRIVIDAGRERVPVYQPRTGLTRLETRQVNRASADQRRGRAGREADGFCYRLWSEETLLAAHREPEITQSDLAALAFELARWGVSDPAALSWVTRPPVASWRSAQQLLQTLGLLQSGGQLTDLGRRCSRWPTHPRLALMLQHADETGSEATSKSGSAIKPLACQLVAWLEEQPGSEELDLARSLDASRQANPRWRQSSRQWAQRLGCEPDQPQAVNPDDLLAELLCHGFPDRIAQNQGGGRFRLIGGGQVTLPENHSLARQAFIIAIDLDGDSTSARLYQAAALPESIVETVFPAANSWQERVYWDNSIDRLVAEQCRVLRVGDKELVLARKPLSVPASRLPAKLLRDALILAVQTRGTLPWSDEDRQLLGRLRLLHKTLGDPWPDVSDPALLLTLDTWLGPHLTGLHRMDQVDRLPLGRHLLESLDWQLQHDLKRLAPTHLNVPSGSSIRLDYSGDEPVLAVKLQEMFGQTQTPTIVDGKVTLLVHLLSPARRPVQVTRDLAGFWAGSYFEVRKDLRGRYPKHPWPDDPLQAPATSKAKPRKPG
jgi:ATP-dependent helicase HrpB